MHPSMRGMCMRTTLKLQLIARFIAVIWITTFVCAIMGTLLINKGTVGQAQDSVTASLDSAREVLNNRLENLESSLYFASSRSSIRAALERKDRLSLAGYLEDIKEKGRFDILDITDGRGNVVLRASNPSLFGDSAMNDDIVKEALVTRSTASAMDVIPYDIVKKEGSQIAGRCLIGPVQGSGPREARPAGGSAVAALALMSASPILRPDGTPAGVLYGGEVLNRNDKLIDKIRHILYQNRKYRGKDAGVVTLFLNDVRISTNVQAPDGTRAVGSTVAEDVRNKVLNEGSRWVGKALVIKDWYVTAYEPVRNLAGKIVGILAVGIVEQKFVDMRRETLTIFLGITLLGMILSIVVATYLSSAIVRPINSLVRVSQKISQGDFSEVVQARSRNEIGELERTFSLMTSSLRERDREIMRLNEQRMARSEKLASVGRLAAGIAHEINNPLTSVLTFSSLLLRKAEDEQKEKLGIIVKETTRCREIVKGLLNFARQSESKREQCDLNEIIENAIKLTKNQLKVSDNHITIVREFEELPALEIDRNQMLEVFINMIINAVDAMPKGGELKASTRLLGEEKAVEIRISDTGNGIPKENLEKIFDPFFTTKDAGKGTGLGLAVTYGIIEGHGGTIDVASEVGKGTSFVITLPLRQPLAEGSSESQRKNEGKSRLSPA